MRKKLTPGNVLFWFWAAMAVGCIVCLIGWCVNIEPVCAVGFVIVIGAAVFHIVCYRCPYCGKHLDRSRGDYCPYCGKALYEEGE